MSIDFLAKQSAMGGPSYPNVMPWIFFPVYFYFYVYVYFYFYFFVFVL